MSFNTCIASFGDIFTLYFKKYKNKQKKMSSFLKYLFYLINNLRGRVNIRTGLRVDIAGDHLINKPQQWGQDSINPYIVQ